MGAAAPFVAVAGGMMVVGGAYQAYSAYQQGKIAKKAAERNAKIAEQAAADSLARGELEASRVRSAGVRAMDKAKAVMLAQGQHAEGAGLADLLTGMAINIETDAETVKNNAARQAWGYLNQADTARFEGEMARYRANQEMIGSVLSTGAQVASLAATAKTPSAAGGSGRVPSRSVIGADGLG